MKTPGVQFPLTQFFFMKLEDKVRRTPEVLKNLNTANNFFTNYGTIFHWKNRLWTLEIKTFFLNQLDSNSRPSRLKVCALTIAFFCLLSVLVLNQGQWNLYRGKLDYWFKQLKIKLENFFFLPYYFAALALSNGKTIVVLAVLERKL